MQRFILDKLDAWRKNPERKPLVLSGARQVGKSTLLKEKLLGSISSMLTPQSGHEKDWLKLYSFPSESATVSKPSERESAFSTDSVSLL